MSDGDALLRTILERPDDDTARLVYADWLQENGQEHFAELIRWQFETGQKLRTFDEGRMRYEPEDGRELIRIPNHLVAFAHEYATRIPAWSIVERGFVYDVPFELAEFIERAPALFASQPVQSVRLMHCEPLGDGEGTYIWTAHQTGRRLDWEIPAELLGCVSRAFPGEDEAQYWLSARCVAYGRELAGLSKMHTAA